MKDATFEDGQRQIEDLASGLPADAASFAAALRDIAGNAGLALHSYKRDCSLASAFEAWGALDASFGSLGRFIERDPDGKTRFGPFDVSDDFGRDGFELYDELLEFRRKAREDVVSAFEKQCGCKSELD